MELFSSPTTSLLGVSTEISVCTPKGSAACAAHGIDSAATINALLAMVLITIESLLFK
jgi:hypothetical protein